MVRDEVLVFSVSSQFKSLCCGTYSSLCITLMFAAIFRLRGDKVTVVKERFPNDNVICNSKAQYFISACTTFIMPITLASSCFSSNVSIPVTTWNNYFFIWQFRDDSLQAVIECILCGLLQSCLRVQTNNTVRTASSTSSLISMILTIV